jgi:hypothetical protein
VVEVRVVAEEEVEEVVVVEETVEGEEEKSRKVKIMCGPVIKETIVYAIVWAVLFY